MQAWHTLSSLGVICIVKLAGYVSIVQDLNRAIVSFFFFLFVIIIITISLILLLSLIVIMIVSFSHTSLTHSLTHRQITSANRTESNRAEPNRTQLSVSLSDNFFINSPETDNGN